MHDQRTGRSRPADLNGSKSKSGGRDSMFAPVIVKILGGFKHQSCHLFRHPTISYCFSWPQIACSTGFSCRTFFVDWIPIANGSRLHDHQCYLYRHSGRNLDCQHPSWIPWSLGLDLDCDCSRLVILFETLGLGSILLIGARLVCGTCLCSCQEVGRIGAHIMGLESFRVVWLLPRWALFWNQATRVLSHG